tara:strand:+ start:116 stop:1375 length:1260 start_codon:yes stop_codon:yes gene_type:complete
MSKVQVDTIVDKDDISAPTFSKGAIVTGVCTATTFVGALTGNADTATTATTTSGNAGGLTGSPSITVTDVGANDVNATGVGTFGSVVSSGAISGTTGTFTGDIDIADKIVHTGDTDTAIRFSAADTVTVETGGTNRITVNNNASVNTLDVAGGARADFFVGRSNQSAPTADASIYRAADNTLALATSSTERLRIGSSGEIGIAGANYGTSGQVLTSGGSGAAISWTTPAGGGWVPVANNSVSSSDSTSTLCDFSSCFDSTYDHYRVEFTCHVADITSTSPVDNLLFRQYDSGSLRTGTDYDYAVNYSGNGSANRSHQSSSGSSTFAYMSGNQDSQAWQGHIDIWNTHETTIQATWNWWMNGYWIYQPDSVANNNRLGVNGVCSVANGSTPVAVTGFKIYTNSGHNLQNGNVVVYGLKTS